MVFRSQSANRRAVQFIVERVEGARALTQLSNSKWNEMKKKINKRIINRRAIDIEIETFQQDE